MKKFAKSGLGASLVSLLGGVSGQIAGVACIFLGGGLALLVRSFFPPMGLAKGLAAWFGGGLMLGTTFGSVYLAYYYLPWNSFRLLSGFLPSFSLGALLVYLSFRN